MAGESDIAYDYTTGGWTCGVCGALVMHNTYHVCGGQPAYQGTSSLPVMNRDAEIVDLLKRIVKLLEKE